jgi:capsular polysaccharide transport system ATP-binding protein
MVLKEQILIAPMHTRSLMQQPEAVLEMRGASKWVVEGVNHSYRAFSDLSLEVFAGERIGIFAANGFEAKALLACLSGVEPLDAGTVEHNASVSWPLGTNDAFLGKLSGYVNARFAAEVYSQPGQIDEDIRLIRELAGVDESMFHEPLADWPSALRDSLKLAVSLAFEFDVVMVGRIGGWNHRAIHPHSVRIRQCFEQRIEGRTLIVCGNGQTDLAIDYCEEGLALVDGKILYRGDPEVCMEMVKEESKRQKERRRERVGKRVAKLVGSDELDDSESDDSLESSVSDDTLVLR